MSAQGSYPWAAGYYDDGDRPQIVTSRFRYEDSYTIERFLNSGGFGITYLGMHTDQQQHAYVLRSGESAAPEGIVAGIAAANRVQDIVMDEFATGRTGNEILAAALARANDEGLRPLIYTHSIGLHGHGAGMTIGLWDRQDGVPGAGDHPLHPDTAYSIELSGASTVPEWGDAEVRFMLEQDAWFDGERCTWLDGRQTDLWLI